MKGLSIWVILARSSVTVSSSGPACVRAWQENTHFCYLLPEALCNAVAKDILRTP